MEISAIYNNNNLSSTRQFTNSLIISVDKTDMRVITNNYPLFLKTFCNFSHFGFFKKKYKSNKIIVL